MSVSTQEHPDHDLLADLAAEVLPGDLAERVQDHVTGCRRCAVLLADAEGIRSMLRQSEPEAMPEQVWLRLERTMIIARQADQPGPRTPVPPTSQALPPDWPVPDTGATRAIRRSRPASSPTTSSSAASPPTVSQPIQSAAAGPPATEEQAARPTPAAPDTSSTRMIRRVQSTGPLPTGRFSTVGSDSPPTSRLSRMSRPAQSARRQALEEQKADAPSRLRPILLVAASVVVVLGLGTGAVKLIGGQGGGSESSAGSAADSASGGAIAAAPMLSAVQSTGTDYTRKDLQAQVATLISTVTTPAPAGSSAARAGSSSVAPLAKQPSDSPSSAFSAAGQQQLLRSPDALKACLNAINADQQPIAVDLARYAGQEAAIIVLPADGGGYEVDVVARDCRPDNDGTIDVVTLSKP